MTSTLATTPRTMSNGSRSNADSRFTCALRSAWANARRLRHELALRGRVARAGATSLLTSARSCGFQRVARTSKACSRRGCGRTLAVTKLMCPRSYDRKLGSYGVETRRTHVVFNSRSLVQTIHLSVHDIGRSTSIPSRWAGRARHCVARAKVLRLGSSPGRRPGSVGGRSRAMGMNNHV